MTALGVLDAHFVIIPEVDTPLGQRPSCALLVVYRLWTYVRVSHLEEWFRSWAPLFTVLERSAARLRHGKLRRVISKKCCQEWLKLILVFLLLTILNSLILLVVAS